MRPGEVWTAAGGPDDAGKSGRADRRNPAHVDLAFGAPRVVGRLHPDPDPGAVAEQLAEANRDGGRNRLPLPKDVVEVLARDAEEASDLRLGLPRRRDHVLAQQRSEEHTSELQSRQYLVCRLL